ncbi:MAG TPA: hypothetical protein VMS98_05305 [Thermoanaerobaculia bacterium]|nr:hypothetical protein [Thermoanaerobaculia bacterium]
MDEDRRRFQRLKLAQPILGTWNGQSALILDIGVGGAFVEHHGMAKPGERASFGFRWQGHEIEFTCEVARTIIVRAPGATGQGPVSHTGVWLVKPVGDSFDRLQEMMASFVGRVLAAHRANAAAVPTSETSAVLAQLGQARRSRTRGYVTYRYNGTAWSRRASESATQPADGFTAAAYEDEEDLDILCRAYETADDEARRMIRLVAELSTMAARK